jgi:hypothetical protein
MSRSTLGTQVLRAFGSSMSRVRRSGRRFRTSSFIEVESLEERRLLASITPTAVISSTPQGADFNYSITLTNSASSTTQIGTFWFAWVPGKDFLATSPISETAPTGWSDTVTNGGATDGFAIQFVAGSDGTVDTIAPGSSMNFSFVSADTPAEIMGDSVFYPGTPVLTSFVYGGAPLSATSDQFVVTPAVAAPTVTALSPTSGPAAGGTTVTITGTTLTGATAVDFGTTPATDVTVVNDTTVTAVSPAGTGTEDVTVTTPAGTSATSSADQFTFVAAAPTVTALAPTSGPAAGGTTVTITGTGLTGATAVDFGTTPATDVTVVSATSVTAVSPAGTGTEDVTVTTPAGTSATSSADQFAFVAAPTVTALAPTTGPGAGGTTVTITGTGLTGATAVDFGTTPATDVTVVSATSVTAVSPAGTGTEDVTVTTPGGTSATSSADQFTFVAAAPAVTAISPTSGPNFGGTTVTITGSSFTGATAVDFGTTPATDVTVVNDTTVTAVSPAGTGTENVTVTTPAGTSPTSAADQFTFNVAAAPAVTAIAPTSGPNFGGTMVTITGTAFTGASAVDFGTTPATDVTVVNDTTITAVSPMGTGTVDVTVTTPAGTSPTSAADQFTFNVVAAPTVTAIAPTTGPAAGGTTVTITGTAFTGATAVDFGMTPATGVTVVNDTTITAVSPAGTGIVDVTVTTPAGTSPASSADQFTFAAVAAPTVASLSPTSGPATGGTMVTITGTGLTGATAVDFGTVAATNVTVVNATTITAVSPAGTGTVDVTVTTPNGTSVISTADQFTFTAVAPTVASLVRFGFHAQQTSLVLTFSTALNATPAQNVNNYQIMTMNGTVIPISSAVYDPTNLTVTLIPSSLLSLHTFYQLTVNGATPNGLTSSTGVALDGAGNGTPGTNFVNVFGGGILVGPAPALLTANPKLFAAKKKALAADEKKWAAEVKTANAEAKKLAIATKKLAVAEQRTAARLAARANGPSASAVDALSAVAELTAKPKTGQNHA